MADRPWSFESGCSSSSLSISSVKGLLEPILVHHSHSQSHLRSILCTGNQFIHPPNTSQVIRHLWFTLDLLCQLLLVTFQNHMLASLHFSSSRLFLYLCIRGQWCSALGQLAGIHFVRQCMNVDRHFLSLSLFLCHV